MLLFQQLMNPGLTILSHIELHAALELSLLTVAECTQKWAREKSTGWVQHTTIFSTTSQRKNLHIDPPTPPSGASPVCLGGDVECHNAADRQVCCAVLQRDSIPRQQGGHQLRGLLSVLLRPHRSRNDAVAGGRRGRAQPPAALLQRLPHAAALPDWLHRQAPLHRGQQLCSQALPQVQAGLAGQLVPLPALLCCVRCGCLGFLLCRTGCCTSANSRRSCPTLLLHARMLLLFANTSRSGGSWRRVKLHVAAAALSCLLLLCWRDAMHSRPHCSAIWLPRVLLLLPPRCAILSRRLLALLLELLPLLLVRLPLLRRCLLQLLCRHLLRVCLPLTPLRLSPLPLLALQAPHVRCRRRQQLRVGGFAQGQLLPQQEAGGVDFVLQGAGRRHCRLGIVPAAARRGGEEISAARVAV